MKIAFYKGTRPFPQGIFNFLVRWWTGGPYSHVEILFGDQMATSSFIDGGVRIKKAEMDLANWDIIDLDDLFNEDKSRKWFKENLGKKYDIFNLLGFIWKRQDGSKKRFTCSEACGSSLGLDSPWRYDPNTLFSIIMSIKGIK